MIMIDRTQQLQHYARLRALLDQLAATVDAVRCELGPASPLVEVSDHALDEVRMLLQQSCARCGARLGEDVLGWEAYAVAGYRRACGSCYEEVCVSEERSTRRMARLTAYAYEHPRLLAGVLAQAQQRRQLSDRGLERWLDLDAPGILRLALCPWPNPDCEDEAVAAIAMATGCTVPVVRALLSEYEPVRVRAGAPAHADTSVPCSSADQDREAWYRALVREIVRDEAARPDITGSSVELLFIADEERGHYLHMTSGFHNTYPMYAIILHLRIKDGKIVIEHDGTGGRVREALTAAGVPDDDIVTSFVDPELTELSALAH